MITILLALQVDIDLNYDTIVPVISPVVLLYKCSVRIFNIAVVMLQYGCLENYPVNISFN